MRVNEEMAIASPLAETLGPDGGGSGLSRRRFVCASAASVAGLSGGGAVRAAPEAAGTAVAGKGGSVTMFLCGDVMLGRGIDQIMPHPVHPVLRERYVTSAEDYVALAERAHGPIPRGVAPTYVWGDALEMLREVAPELRIINLETSITEADEFWPKAVNYRMSPRHADVLTAAGVDCCALANNHLLDFGREGLVETLATLDTVGVEGTGAGRDSVAAAAPAALGVAGKGRVLVFSYGSTTSGIPREWAAAPEESGVNLLPDLSDATLTQVVARAEAARQPGDLLVASIHWGGNWSYAIPQEQVRFARGLIDGGFDVVHGHSSHHAKAVEIYHDKPVMYGCGDFITDYEGISGHEEYRGDISVAYLPRFSRPGNDLVGFRLVGFRMRNFRLERLPPEDAEWLGRVLEREAADFGTDVLETGEGEFSVSPR